MPEINRKLFYFWGSNMATTSNTVFRRNASGRTRNLRGTAALMVVAIVGITGFQAYWLKNNYDREKQSLDLRTNDGFRQTVLRLQASKLALENAVFTMDSTKATTVDIISKRPCKKSGRRNIKFSYEEKRAAPPPITIINLIQEKLRDSANMDSTLKLYLKQKAGEIRHQWIEDSARGTIRSITISETDSGFVRRVRIDTGHKSRMIAVGVGDMRPGEKKADTLVIGGHFEEFITPERVPLGIRRELPPPGDVLVGAKPFNNPVFRFLYDIDSLSVKDSVTTKEITEAFTRRLKDEEINIGFTVTRLDSTDTTTEDVVAIGFSKPLRFKLSLQGTLSYMFDKLKLPILFSILLVGITMASFVLLYRNMMKQKRLADLKNEFISNITHELKTPIATVGVAIEALKNFNAIDDPRRTKEYLDISQNELQRLNLLVDKVLKLSMFEKKEVELKQEDINLEDIVNEVVTSMRLQIEKYRAQVTVSHTGNTMMKGDKLHLLSVVFNLLDNALKYSKENPVIHISMEGQDNAVVLKVEDNGIGISPAYKNKVFEKFFRVPHGDTHNAKGYGLGLSYAAQVIGKHKGTITVDSVPGNSATFTITLPR
jgi:two-component system, OmpR family, phosphate regulon sensor histidine kinase PhoR